MATHKERENWGSRIGLILAVAGNAVGLGNFLRFPVQAAQNGGGTFMIPYFIFFLILGIPLMWIEWGIGRHGGKFKHGSTPGMFDALWKNRISKYLGSLGLFISFIIMVYYTYLTSWTLGFSFFSITKMYFGLENFAEMKTFLYSYQGREVSSSFSNIAPAYIFMVLTFAANFFILYKGISKGIEKLAKIALPALFVFAIIIAIRVFTLGTPNPNMPENSIMSGFAFIWNPDLTRLGDPKIWLAAAGQIFFTLSVGMGAIQAYASYLRPKDDIVLSGLTTAATNEFAEVILGGSIAIPIAVAFFGVTITTQMATGGAFDLGFASLPLVFERLPFGEIFGFMWFLLLFFAGITSSVAMGQPIIAFLEDEFGLSKKAAVSAVAALSFVCVQFVVFYLKFGVLNEMDYWAGTFGLVIFALFEIIIFMWVFGSENAFEELNRGGDIRIPNIFKYIMKYITPLVLIAIITWWSIQDAIPIFLLKGVSSENIPYILATRIGMLLLLIGIFYLVHKAWKKRGTEWN